MANHDRRKKDGKDKGKKLRRMREDRARRRANSDPDDDPSDQADLVTYKPGSSQDRNRHGAV